MIRTPARAFAASLAAAFALSTVAVGRAVAQAPQASSTPVAQLAAQDNISGGPRLAPQQKIVSGRDAFRQGGSNAYRADTVVITASTLALVALVVLLLLIL